MHVEAYIHKGARHGIYTLALAVQRMTAARTTAACTTTSCHTTAYAYPAAYIDNIE